MKKGSSTGPKSRKFRTQIDLKPEEPNRFFSFVLVIYSFITILNIINTNCVLSLTEEGVKMMKLWEYDSRKIHAVHMPQQMTDLEKIGNEGWELVLIKDDLDDNGTATAIFKREKK